MTIAGPPLEANSTVDKVDKASYAHRSTGRTLPAWPAALLTTTATTLIATGATPLLTGAGPQAAAAAAAVGTLASAGIVTAAVCHERRQEITASAQASIERIAGPVHRFRAHRWRGGLVGTPQLVRFRYQPAAVVANKTWPGAGAAVLADVLGARYRVSRHDPRLGRITLRLKREAPTETPSVEVERATTMMQHLFGQTASVQTTSDAATLSKVVVQHECGVKATFPIWRERVETSRHHDARRAVAGPLGSPQRQGHLRAATTDGKPDTEAGSDAGLRDGPPDSARCRRRRRGRVVGPSIVACRTFSLQARRGRERVCPYKLRSARRLAGHPWGSCVSVTWSSTM